MESVPTPATVARAFKRQAQEPKPGQDFQAMLRLYPRIAEEVSRYGIDVTTALEAWEAQVGVQQVSNLLSESSSPFLRASGIYDTSHRRELPLLAYLVAEAILAKHASSLAGYMRSSRTSLEAVLAGLAERLGEALLGAAFAITWQRRAVFGRLLDGARAYLEWTRQAAILAGEVPRRGVQTRLAIAAVLASRFLPITEHELRDAREMLLDSHERGSETALEYYIEASIWLYDLYDDAPALREAAQQILKVADENVAKSAMAAHLWLRLAGTGSRPTGALRFAALAREAVGYQNRWVTNRFQDATLTLLSATLDQFEEDVHVASRDLSTRGVLLPFGHRRPDTPTAPIFERSLPRLINALAESTWSGDFVFRDLRATFLSLYARSPDTGTGDALNALREAISARLGSPQSRTRPLNRPGIEIDQAADRFLLADLSSSSEMRRSGFIDLMRASEPEDLRPRYLTLIAKEVEERGPLLGGFLPGPPNISLAVRTGDASTIFVAAARAAYQSADLTRVLLGGRGDVVTLRDSDGTAGQTFVYKRTRPEAMARDAAYSASVAAELAKHGLSDDFGLIEHIAEIVDVDTDAIDSEAIISVRRFSDGVPLLDFMRLQEPHNTTAVLKTVARYLALIHHAGASGTLRDGMRSSLKQTEIGRWLRSLKLEDSERAAFFERWWSIVADAPVTPRRDAHPLNWLISSDSHIRAVDLESKGARPLGYELAQLVEDGQVLRPEDRLSRSPILTTYADYWRELTHRDFDDADFLAWYDAGAVARAIRAISQPAANPEQRAYGGELLSALARTSSDERVRDLASDLSVRWNRLKGRVGETGVRALSEADRRRISRAMSYHLRHDRTAPATKSGWVHADELAIVMREAGHRVSSEQLLLIAGALGEQRFQLEGEEIRALYGHSIPVEIFYESRRPPEVLFHATPTRNLASVFEARAGLLPGARNWVHLTESCLVAVNAARRQGAAVSVLAIDSGSVSNLKYAAGTTWLAAAVPVAAIRLLPVRHARAMTQENATGSL